MQCDAQLTRRRDESWTQTRKRAHKRTHAYTNVWCKGSGWSLSCAEDQTVTLPSSSSKHPVGPEIEGEGVRRDGRRCYLQEGYLIKCQKCYCLTASKHAPSLSSLQKERWGFLRRFLVLTLSTKEIMTAKLQKRNTLRLQVIPQFHGYFPNLRKLNDIQFISVRNGNLETLNWHFHAN